jgi:enoyl-CoA hydratase
MLFDAPTLACTCDANGVAVLTMNRPERRNALDGVTMRALAEAIRSLEAEPRVRVLVVTGAGKEAFCSGGDLFELSQRLTVADAEAMLSLMGDALLRLERLPYPVIAAINGFALGGGSELAVACDIRIVDERANLGFVQVRRGLITGWGGGQRLLRLVGYARALELLLRAEPLDAQELLRLGLVMQVMPSGHALSGALDFAQSIAAHDRNAVAAAKQMLQAGMQRPYEEGLAAERSLFPALWTGETHLRVMQEFSQRQNGRS